MTEHWLKSDPASGHTIVARTVLSAPVDEADDSVMFLWFVGIEGDDRWLIYWASDEDGEETADEISQDIKVHRLVRLITLIGQPWDELSETPDAFADLQSDYMHRLSKEQYLELMNMTLDQVREYRGLDEAQVIAELTGGPEPSMN